MISEEFINKLFTIPYVLGGRSEDGADCWGLVIICYKDLFNITLPSYEHIAWSVSNGSTTAEGIADLLDTSAPFVKVGSPDLGDFVLINILGNPVHIGFMINKTTMIHTSDKIGVASDDIRGRKWQKRIQGFYRHKDLEK